MPESILSFFQGPFNFLSPGLGEARLLFPELERDLPLPVPIFIGGRDSTPVYGFPIAQSPGLSLLEGALRDYLLSEERLQTTRLDGGTSARFTLKEQQEAWNSYRDLLIKISSNVMTSNFGRAFPGLFWLQHSLVVAKVLQGTAGRVRKHDLEVGRRQGDALRYVVLFQFLENVFAALFDLAGKLARETGQLEDVLFPRLLTQLRDNVLLFTHDHIGKDLKELTGYFHGYLKLDGRELLYRYALLRTWHREEFEVNNQLRASARAWSGGGEAADPDDYLFRPGYLEHLSAFSSYDADKFFSQRETHLWSALVLRLKEFECLHAARRLITPLSFENGRYSCDSRSARRFGVGGGPRHVDSETRFYDFTARWVVDPEVSRSGLIYDIRDFSSIISILRQSERRKQHQAFQQFLFFQHRIENIVGSLYLRSEKYLGDGAFFSGRNSLRILAAAIKIQRAYQEAREAGLPFDKGMRLALNFATYHLLPLGTGDGASGRHEVYGHGLVELTRLVSGKRGFEIEDVKTLLLSRGYDTDAVAEFFQPLIAGQAETVERQEHVLGAFLDANGTLVNDGIVASQAFLARIEAQYSRGPLRVFRRGKSSFVGIQFHLEELSEQRSLFVGFRRLGLARLKGLGQVPVFEIVDGSVVELENATIPRSLTLAEAVEAEFSSSLSRSTYIRS